MKTARVVVVAVLLVAGAWAQQIKIPPALDKLASIATEVVDVNLDKQMLQFASRFMDKSDADAKRVVQNLNGIYVRSYEFAKPGQYNPEDVAPIRAQLQSGGWSKMVQTRSKKEGDVDIFVRPGERGIMGMVIIATEPLELTVVHIDGLINPDDLNSLGGNFGIPKGVGLKSRPQATGNATRPKGTAQ